MSSPFTPLLPVAMVGTDRQPMLPAAWPGPAGSLIHQALDEAPDTASGLLRACAVLAGCSLAGMQGAPWPTPLPPPAGADDAPALPPGPLVAGLAWALHEGPARLQHEALGTLAAVGRRLPHALLPQALEAGRRSLALRAALLPVLGPRGAWLAAQRDDWRFAAGPAADAGEDSRWAEGSLEQRREWLWRERARDPAAARGHLTAALPELPAKDRAELAEVLSQALGGDDEPLLDQLRQDRSCEVRQVALALLLNLPRAAHVQRAQARMGALLRHERVLLRQRWTLDAPAAPADDWKADNIDPARPQGEALGERAWWLYQLVRQVPLAWWTRHTALDADELLAWAGKTDWQEALLRGWRDVLLASPQEDWCEALLRQWPHKVLRDDPARVLALLPLAARERHWQLELEDPAAPLQQALAQQLLAACPPGETLSAPLSAALAARLRQGLESRQLQDDYAARALLPELACLLHPQALEPLAEPPRRADDTPSFSHILQTLGQVLALRQALHTLRTTP